VTVVGLLPLMFQLHPNFRVGHIEYRAPGSEWWVQLSAAVVWGLSFATLLTLVLTPVMLAAPKVYGERLSRAGGWSRRKLGLAPRQGPAPHEDALPRAAE
jgi:multidrug efflux pump